VLAALLGASVLVALDQDSASIDAGAAKWLVGKWYGYDASRVTKAPPILQVGSLEIRQKGKSLSVKFVDDSYIGTATHLREVCEIRELKVSMPADGSVVIDFICSTSKGQSRIQIVAPDHGESGRIHITESEEVKYWMTKDPTAIQRAIDDFHAKNGSGESSGGGRK
jgi:hypothetical protein